MTKKEKIVQEVYELIFLNGWKIAMSRSMPTKE